ncbi:MAG TPA: M20/M25/M40 family metallo-hydrolase [Oscillospiraceae bacterium]|nr:M20/M25/M40 family metallo-hydrolase [Oscillospiraceae bacterium]HPS35266.1 M20/M25/M40 family metallo-hydrolase [Oscillospiraceae bacterium]
MLLKELTQRFGVSGVETGVAEFIKKTAAPYVDEFIEGGLGSVIAVKKGSSKTPKKIMPSAHMDEIGFCVMSFTSGGMVRIRAVGGIPIPLTIGQRIRFANGVIGAVSADCAYDDVKGNFTKLYADIGAKDKEDAEKLLSVGDFACYDAPYTEMANNRVCTKALDNRIGCYILLECMKKYQNPVDDIYYVFSSQEEVGLRGARTAAQLIDPDEGIAVDIGGCFDTPESAGKGNPVLGGGAAIKVMDMSVICDQGIVKKMKDIAAEKNIKVQLEVLAGGGTDAGAINQVGEGKKTGGISIPTRYGHGPISMVDLNDVQNCIDLLGEYISFKK